MRNFICNSSRLFRSWKSDISRSCAELTILVAMSGSIDGWGSKVTAKAEKASKDLSTDRSCSTTVATGYSRAGKAIAPETRFGLKSRPITVQRACTATDIVLNGLRIFSIVKDSSMSPGSACSEIKTAVNATSAIALGSTEISRSIHSAPTTCTTGFPSVETDRDCIKDGTPVTRHRRGVSERLWRLKVPTRGPHPVAYPKSPRL
mmetsp:Transcript_27804/g.83144  ORF Transcript_27804/g.83144 Transcript_27804/m.83144 type:complete len:205 (-) Transcript_27804:1445-2059(-)